MNGTNEAGSSTTLIDSHIKFWNNGLKDLILLCNKQPGDMVVLTDLNNGAASDNRQLRHPGILLSVYITKLWRTHNLLRRPKQ